MEIFSGEVHQGKQLGRTIGFPTANISYKSTTLQSGTYKINGSIGGKIYGGVGVYFQERSLFESHFFCYSGDCYGEEITIIPLVKIRENEKFESLEKLQKQIEHDKNRALENKITVMTFGTFDHFHKGHEWYLSQARFYGDKLITIIARDKTVESIKSLTPTHNELERLSHVEKSGLVDCVQLGDVANYYTCFEQHSPDVICLGYDQRSFDNGIKERYKKQGGVLPHIIRLESFNPEQFKSSYFRK